ncbi:two-component system regulatory protein YycI [Geosporobacter ferrireducens]|uniref:Regulatory protein YycH-like domain-containing protein n=1 Tax=Geosporobacter ferrireducens TaxID=1424294 RepID=A0A1D8GI20_9FIRM|nr:two-component system regulatory protein YycI [Geosporobacter ferrireducens]AOT70548.1 hypothetical protein Gferi_13785 [Geosporobacter ferrireducens]MTI57092.1 hypothetical protein [Geosporobacter ferrireducens]
MDWSKAKNILIIAFIITNLFLIFNIQSNLYENNSLSVLKDRNIEDVVAILADRNIKVEAEIPRILLQMPVLDVEYETYNEEKVVQRFGRGGPISQNNSQEQIEVTKNKIIIYKNNSRDIRIKNINESKAREEAERFIKDHGYMRQDVEYWNTFEEEGQYEVIYKQKYKGYFLEMSYMRLIVTQAGVTEFERMWLKPLQLGEHKNEIMPATKALLKVMNVLEDWEQETIITEISLGYLFDPSKISLTNWENIKSGRALPAWRMTLKDGETIFIDAYENY